MKITVLSGKGGVGKSSITASLAVLLSKNKSVVVADCDVDAPNLALVLGAKFHKTEKLQTNEKAVVDYNKCTKCKKCYEACYFQAIEWKDKPVVNPYFCEGCGVCSLVCPANAVRQVKVENAEISYGRTKYGFNIVSGQLKMGESGSGKVVAYIKKMAEKEEKDITLVDSAAGIGCPVIASVTGSDYVVAVTEPTPSALSDLKRAMEMVKHFEIPAGLVINRYDINKRFTKKIEKYAEEEKIKLLGKLPYDKRFVEAIVNLTPIVVYDKIMEEPFEEIVENIGGVK